VKQPKCGVNYPHHSIAEVTRRVQPYLYSPWAFMACYRENFTFLPIAYILIFIAFQSTGNIKVFEK
jgi:hypothetical protein